MFGSPLLGTAIGLVLLFATVSLLCSGITESLSNVLQLRAKYLLTGLRAMLDAPERRTDAGTRTARNVLHDRVKDQRTTQQAAELVRAPQRTSWDPAVSPLTTALFDSPLVRSLQSRRVGLLRSRSLRNPQYLEPRTFARALVDLLVATDPDGVPPAVVTLEQVRATVEGLPETLPIRRQLLAFLSRAGEDVTAFERDLEQWYDTQMAEISGWYKRWARVVLGCVGLVVAVLVNIDTVQVTHVLYVDAPVQQAVLAAADAGTLCQAGTDAAAREACVDAELTALQTGGLPLGYPGGCDPLAGEWGRCWSWSATDPVHGWDFPLKLVGWGITAFAVSFGAPFWFDALSRLGSLRNTGRRPEPAPSP
jgi:hypothetical protein